MRAKQLAAVPAIATSVFLAGCGGSPRLAHSLATRLAGQADEIAARLQAGDTCGAAALTRALRREASTVGQGALGAELRRRVDSLASRIGPCVQPPPPSPPPPPKKDHGDHGHGNHNKDEG